MIVIMGEKSKLISVILLGIGFMMVFSSFQTWGNMQKTVVDSIKNEDGNFTGEGYYSLSIIYVVFSLFLWTAPSLISALGPKIPMIYGSIVYVLYILSYLCESTWIMYAMSALLGTAAAFIWTGQGNYLTLNSTKETIARNTGIFWALLQCSLFIGNLYIYVAFQGKNAIDRDTRKLAIWILATIGLIGVGTIVILPPVRRDEEQVPKEELLGPLESFKGAAKLLATKNMLLLCVTFFYTGLELTFWSGVYSSAIGATLSIEASKELVGLSGVFLGIGEVLGGMLFGIFGEKFQKLGKTSVVLMGFLMQSVAFFLICVSIPNEAVFGDTTTIPYYQLPSSALMLCSFLLGYGDACFNTQIYALLGDVYSSTSASAFAIFKCVQSIAAAAAFFYSSNVSLCYQIGVLGVVGIFATITIAVVDHEIRREHRKDKE